MEEFNPQKDYVEVFLLFLLYFFVIFYFFIFFDFFPKLLFLKVAGLG